MLTETGQRSDNISRDPKRKAVGKSLSIYLQSGIYSQLAIIARVDIRHWRCLIIYNCSSIYVIGVRTLDFSNLQSHENEEF